MLVFTAWIETREAHRVVLNRRKGEADDDDMQEWQRMAVEVDFEVEDTWREAVGATRPDVRVDGCVSEVRELKGQVSGLTEMVNDLVKEKEAEVGK